ncbi:helix-turn-helix domain-containing protein [Pseudovibrio sp. JE062]|uniref:helix-turn-helix domain-containing protein n=1 Tax=Pseudovibrio sp. JE062 TaxID=439495 RepID=UPI0002F7E4F5|nr:helix-turn-helix domain-containing protein [Pseudovibrio sp. JE062]
MSEVIQGETISRLPRNSFSLESIRQKDRFAVWRESLACLCEAELHSGDDQLDFFGEVKSVLFGSIMLSQVTAQAHIANRTNAAMAKDGVDHYLLMVHDEGEAEFYAGDRSVTLGKGDTIFLDFSQEGGSFSRSYSNRSILIAREQLAPLLQGPDDCNLKTLPAAHPLNQILREHISSISGQSNKLDMQQAQQVVPATMGLIAACLNGVPHDSEAGRDGVNLALMTRARRIIEANLTNPNLSPDLLTGAVNVSRSKLYELFLPYGGVSKYIRDRRMKAVLRALMDPRNTHRATYQVALDFGFTNESSFSRMFKHNFGFSPRDVRARLDDIATAARTQSQQGRQYEDWILNLS